MKAARIIAGLLGVVLLVAIVARVGFSDVAKAFQRVGFGLIGFVLYHTVPLAFDAAGWWSLFFARRRAQLSSIFWIRLASESVNNLLPVAQVGGEVVRARLGARLGVSLQESAATVVADVTLGALADIGFASLSFALLVLRPGQLPDLPAVALALATFAAAIALLLLAQRAGVLLGGIRVAARLLPALRWEKWLARAALLESALAELYARRRGLWAGLSLRALARAGAALELWLGLWLLGSRVPASDALILHGLTGVIRSAAFAIPGGYGVVEGGFVLVGGWIGLAAETALTLALMRRARELLFGIPGWIAWVLLEHRRA